MANELIGIDIEGLEPLIKKLDKVPNEVKNAALDDVADYMVNVMQLYPAFKRVTRKQAYGVTFFSDKQRRWFFGALNRGEIQAPYKRTQTLRRGWKVIDRGNSAIVVNEVGYAKHLHGSDFEKQSRMAKMIGWKEIPTVIKERAGRIAQIADAALKKGMRKAGL